MEYLTRLQYPGYLAGFPGFPWPLLYTGLECTVAFSLHWPVVLINTVDCRVLWPLPTSKYNSVEYKRLYSLIQYNRLYSLIQYNRLYSLTQYNRLHSLIQYNRLASSIHSAASRRHTWPRDTLHSTLYTQ